MYVILVTTLKIELRIDVIEVLLALIVLLHVVL
jgi:hypothetical protein